MRVRAICFAALLVGTVPAQADTLCAEIAALNVQSRDVQMTLPGTQDTVACTRSLMLAGGVQMHCGWAFAYRAPRARDAFDRLMRSVAACLGEGAAVTTDLDVNHPDYYDLQTFQSGGQEIGVSLKDKAALSETYVFLRIALPQ